MHLQPTEEMYRSGNGGPTICRKEAERQFVLSVKKRAAVKLPPESTLRRVHILLFRGGPFFPFLIPAPMLWIKPMQAIVPSPGTHPPPILARSFWASPLFFLLLAPDNDDVDDAAALIPIPRNNVPFRLWIGIGVINLECLLNPHVIGVKTRSNE